MHENAFTINMKDLDKGPVTLNVDATPEALDLQDPEFEFGQVRGEITFTQARPRVVTDGELSTVATARCVRCLGDAVINIKAPVHAIYENEKLIRDTRSETVAPEEQVITPYNGDWIQPEPELREAVLLELPSLPTCREDCKGLCPRCGANLNEGTCDCPVEDDEVSSWKSAIKGLKLE